MSIQDLQAQIKALEAEAKMWKKMATLENKARAEAEDEKIHLERDLEAKVARWEKIALREEEKWEMEFNKHMETQRLLKATQEGYDTMLSINKQAVKEIDDLKLEKKNLKHQLKKSQDRGEGYRRDYIFMKHEEATGSGRGNPEATLWDAYENGLYCDKPDLIEAYEDEDLKEVEDFMRKKRGLPTFCEEWKEREGLEYPNYKKEEEEEEEEEQ